MRPARDASPAGVGRALRFRAAKNRPGIATVRGRGVQRVWDRA